MKNKVATVEYKILSELEAFKKAGFPEPRIYDWTDAFRLFDCGKRKAYEFSGEVATSVCSVIPFDCGYIVDFYSQPVKTVACHTLAQVVKAISAEYKRLKNQKKSHANIKSTENCHWYSEKK